MDDVSDDPTAILKAHAGAGRAIGEVSRAFVGRHATLELGVVPDTTPNTTPTSRS